MNANLKILFVEDSVSDAELIWHEILKNKIAFDKVLVDNKQDFLIALNKFIPDIIISDYSLPNLNGMDALLLRNENSPFIPFLLVTGSISEEVAVECIKAGADDYILKENLSRLVPAIITSLNKSKLTKEKKAAEDELYKSEQRLQKAQSIAHVGNWEIDLSTRMVWCSDEALAIYGFGKDQRELPIVLLKSIPLPEYRPILDEIFDDLLKHNEVYEIEFKAKRVNDGEIRTIFSKAELLVVPGSAQVKVVGVIHDITDRKLAEEGIDQERRMLRTLIDNLPDTIYVQDRECRKVIANAADVKYTGFSSESEVLGKTDLELFSGEAGVHGFAEDEKVILTGKPIIDLEEEFTQPDGSKRWLLSTKIPLRDKSGKITGLVGIGHEITERKRVEAELIRAKVKAEESDRLKTAFLHNISHEIRTPMNAIVGFSALLSEPDIDKQCRESYVEVIMQSSNQLLQIISDIVDISNIEANIIKTSKNEVNVNHILKSLISQYTPIANIKKIELSYEPGMPDSDAMILTDNIKLSQILSNILNNALKFTMKGSVKISYSMHDYVLDFKISDTGIGIAAEHFNKIFERFYQVQNTVSRLYEGTGLGLSISKAYAEHMGGEIWLTSEPGKGTTFYITIPYEKANKVPPEVSVKARNGLVFTGKKRVILVAEDVESNYKLIIYFLSGSNVELIHASNGKEAVEICFANPNIDLILMDIKMPVMDGYTAVKLIREKNNKIPIIAQTAYADDREKAIESGCSGFISKPFDKKGLFNVLHEFI